MKDKVVQVCQFEQDQKTCNFLPVQEQTRRTPGHNSSHRRYSGCEQALLFQMRSSSGIECRCGFEYCGDNIRLFLLECTEAKRNYNQVSRSEFSGCRSYPRELLLVEI